MTVTTARGLGYTLEHHENFLSGSPYSTAGFDVVVIQEETARVAFTRGQV